MAKTYPHALKSFSVYEHRYFFYFRKKLMLCLVGMNENGGNEMKFEL